MEPESSVAGRKRFWAGLVALALTSALGQLWLRSQPSIGWYALGDDAQFWLARVNTIAASPLVGSHPPAYPTAVWLGAMLLPTTVAGSLVAGLAACVLPVAGALLVRRMAGWERGLLAGAFTLALPCLQFSGLKSEATTLYGVVLAVLLWAGLRLDRRRSLGAALLTGLCLAALVLTKEQGLVMIPGLVLLPLLRRPWRPGRAAVLALGCALGLAPFVVAELRSPEPGVFDKIELPLIDMARWFQSHVVPSPMRQHHVWEPATDAGLDAGGSARIFWALALRAAHFAGPWCVLAPLSVVGIWRARRDPTVDGGAVRVLLLAATGILPVFAVPVLGRHVELSLLPLAWGLPLAVGVSRGGPVSAPADAADAGARPTPGGTPRTLPLALRVVGIGLCGVLGVWGWFRLAPAEVSILQSSATNIATYRAHAARIGSVVPAGARLCARQPWVAAFADLPVDCRGVFAEGTVGYVHLERVLVKDCDPWLAGLSVETWRDDLMLLVDSPALWTRATGLNCGAAARERKRRSKLGH